MSNYFKLIFLLLIFLLIGCSDLTTTVEDTTRRVENRLRREWSALTPSGMMVAETPAENGRQPTLDDYWDGTATFEVDVPVTGLPMGESDTVVLQSGMFTEAELWSYVHASDRSAGTIDRCGEPVEFPGCTVIYRSEDGGVTFTHEEPPVCQFDCNQCPCTSQFDHVEQQQYPRVAYDGARLHVVYEYKGMVMYRESHDGLVWSHPVLVPMSGMWDESFAICDEVAQIRPHPYTEFPFHCLVGGPPGVYAENGELYVFVGLGQNPSSMGCYVGTIGENINVTVETLTHCTNNPLFTGASEYGPGDDNGPATNPYFDFRTISSADIQKVGDRYYMLYEGVRGPSLNDPGDTQFALGLARTITNEIDGEWETYEGNPILVDMPGNIGVGHADVLVMGGMTYLYTSLDGETRSRLKLVWSE